MICESTSRRRIDTIPPLSISLRFDLLCTSNKELVWQRYHGRNLYRPFKLNRIRLPKFHNLSLPASLHFEKS
jgi:hypothetical protein